jgi:sugar phosphate isomerase/epimerase
MPGHDEEGRRIVNEDIRRYARLGLCHHMLYPRGTEDFDNHVETLAAFAQRADIETFDSFMPYGEQRRAKLIPLIRQCGKTDVTFAVHLFPFRRISFTEPGASLQGLIRVVLEDTIAQVAAAGGTGLIFPSGPPAPEEATPAHYAAFTDFCRWLCGRCARHGIIALLEPFDTNIDKRFLYGLTEECVRLIESLRSDGENLAIELDMAHVPLMGETFSQAIQTVAPYLKRVHLGNCILRDRRHPLYGDKHPPMGYDGGEIGTPELSGILRCLLDVGYLDSRRRGNLVVEMTPWPGRSMEETIAGGWARIEEAWRAV